MSKEGIATLQHASMGLLCDPRKQEEILNDLWVEWVKLALELELENIVRRKFPGHSEGTYDRLERWIDEVGFIGSDDRFLAQKLWSVIVSWFAAGAFTNWWQLPRQSRGALYGRWKVRPGLWRSRTSLWRRLWDCFCQ